MAQPKNIRLIRDVLDKLLVDRSGMPVGRVDGIVLLLSGEHSPPRVIQIESGASTLARRWNHQFESVIRWTVRKLGLRWRRPVRIPWHDIDSLGRELQLNVCGEDSPLLARERWLRDHIIRRIPRSGAQTKSP
jgi:hypothetical protein